MRLIPRTKAWVPIPASDNVEMSSLDFGTSTFDISSVKSQQHGLLSSDTECETVVMGSVQQRCSRGQALTHCDVFILQSMLGLPFMSCGYCAHSLLPLQPDGDNITFSDICLREVKGFTTLKDHQFYSSLEEHQCLACLNLEFIRSTLPKLSIFPPLPFLTSHIWRLFGHFKKR